MMGVESNLDAGFSRLFLCIVTSIVYKTMKMPNIIEHVVTYQQALLSFFKNNLIKISILEPLTNYSNNIVELWVR